MDRQDLNVFDYEADALSMQTMFDVMPDLEWGEMLLSDIDLSAQRMAVRALITRNREASDTVQAEIANLDELARRVGSTQLTNEWVDECHWSVYHDAANSLAAVGMLMPLLESILKRGFEALGEQGAVLKAGGERAAVAGKAWDPRFVVTGGEASQSLLRGAVQLAAESGLEARLSADYRDVLRALFAYRNAMFHNGLEWPADQKLKFEQRRRTWPADWFSCSTSNGEPWVYYMTEAFVDRCLCLVDEIVAGFGAMYRALPPRPVSLAAPWANG